MSLAAMDTDLRHCRAHMGNTGFGGLSSFYNLSVSGGLILRGTAHRQRRLTVGSGATLASEVRHNGERRLEHGVGHVHGLGGTVDLAGTAAQTVQATAGARSARSRSPTRAHPASRPRARSPRLRLR